mgnify:CR=1 FL=1
MIDDFGNQNEVGEPGEHGRGEDHPGSPYGETQDEGAVRGIPGGERGLPDPRPDIKENTSKGGFQGVWDKQKQEWSQAPGKKAAVGLGSSLVFSSMGLKTGNPIAIAGGLVADMFASAAGLYGPQTAKGMYDTDSWYGNNMPAPPPDPHAGGDDPPPQPKKRKAPKPVYSAGSGNKPDLLVSSRAAQRRYNKGVYNV